MKKILNTSSPFWQRPEVGMGVTWQLGSDRVPGTIIDISPNGEKITFQEDSYTRTDGNGMSDCQEYTFQRDLQGTIHIATLRKDGIFRLTGSKMSIIIGIRSRYYDFSF